MKCPYPDCQKDYNDSEWEKDYDGYVNDADGADMFVLQRIYLVSRKCHFCHQLFHEVYVGHQNRRQNDENGNMIPGSTNPTLELISAYPTSKTTFRSKNVPSDIRSLFHEAERCRSIGAMTGVAACLRKTVYAICDQQGVAGNNYREKIGNLPLKEEVYKELLKQVKFLGDNGTKSGGDIYTHQQVDIALSVLPVVIDKIYEQDERVDEAQRILANVRSQAA